MSARVVPAPARAQFGTVPLAAYSVAYSLEPVVFMLPIGLSTGLANSVGNKLGARQPIEARRLAATGLSVGVVTVGLYVAAMFVAGDALAALFSRDAAVLARTRVMWPWFCVFMLISGPFALMLGLNRGLGLQRATAACVLALVWPLGAPLVLFWARTPSNVWQSLSVTYSLLVGAMALCAGCSSWAALAERAHAASGAGTGADHAEAGVGAHELPDAARSSSAGGAGSGGLAAADAEAAKARQMPGDE